MTRHPFPILKRTFDNLFVATMLLCLAKERPTILLEKQFVPLKNSEASSKAEGMQILNYDSVKKREEQKNVIPAMKGSRNQGADE